MSNTQGASEKSVRVAIKQWRDALINLSGLNPLLNYRPSSSRTIEFVQHTTDEVLGIINSANTTFIRGTKEPERSGGAESSEGLELEEELLDQLGGFDSEGSSSSDYLYANTTQRTVDRALRNLDASYKLELIDKGIRTLYVVLGELRWRETSGDARRSPLILLPVELDSAAARERKYLRAADEDLVVNPALSLLVMQQYGLQLPTTEDIASALESAGVASALDLFRSIAWPNGWQVRDFAALGSFKFAKEAMYRDLIDNEDAIAESPLVQSLAGSISADNSPFNFEPHGDHDIDEVAPPETTPLVLDADSSQRAAIQAAVEGRSFTLDGPPGTGKSQTIANIIGALIEAGKTVLFVSEKAVALDVVRNRLAHSGLEPFLFELHSSKANRREIAARLGNALNSMPVAPAGMGSVELTRLREARQELSSYVQAVNEIRQPLGSSYHAVLGRLEQLGQQPLGPAFAANVLEVSDSSLAKIVDLIERLTKRWPMALQGERAAWYGLLHHRNPRFELQQLATALDTLDGVLDDSAEVRNTFGLGTLADLHRTIQLLERWHAEPSFHVNPWLDQAEIVAVGAALADYEQATETRARAEQTARAALGEMWKSVRVFPSDGIPRLEGELLALPDVSGNSTQQSLIAAADGLRQGLSGLTELARLAEELSTQLGARRPQTPAEVGRLISAARAVLADDAPEAEWIHDPESRGSARSIAEQTMQSQLTLEEAEEVAEGSFTEDLLTIDLAALETSAEENKGFFRRFSSDHKAMRAALSEVSPLTWQQAVAALPTARRWFDAQAAYDALLPSAQSILGHRFSADRTTDWDAVTRCLENADATVVWTFLDPSATSRLLHSQTSIAAARVLVDETDRVLGRWNSDLSVWAATDGSHEDFHSLETRLRDRDQLLRPVLDLVAAQAAQLGQTATLASHLEAARARSSYEQSARSATEAAHRLVTLGQLEGVASELAGVDVGLVHHKLRWATAVLEAANAAGGERTALRNDQITALRRSEPPLAGATDVLQSFEKYAERVVSWFSEERQAWLRADLRDQSTAVELVEHLTSAVDEIDDWFSLGAAVQELTEAGFGPALAFAKAQELPQQTMPDFLLATLYRSWLDAQLAGDPRLASGSGDDRDDLVQRFRRLDADLAGAAVAKIIEAGAARRPRSSAGQAAIIQREAQKKRKHMPVRDLIGQAKDVVLALHPCFMMSPLAVSQYLPAEQMFDVVIFDEASQVLPADAINCIYRGSALIAAGDQKQLPPTAFFQTSIDDGDEDGEEDVANDFESILDLMKSSGAFTPLSLRWHYRSRHENLIAYSNASFYDSRLITFPGALHESEDAGVRFIKVDGVYRRSLGRNNPIEARHVAERVIHHFSTRPDKTLGVVAFSTPQRDAIENAIELARGQRPDLDQHFGEDRVDGFFVKNLESVQGDERDVIIFSIGYGRDQNGKMYNNFGPLGKKGGERRLNVAITRAKQLVEVVSSISASDIGEVTGAGSRHLRRYLDFAERGPSSLEIELGPSGMDTESPFEDAVVSYVTSLGFAVQPQVGVAGYRIDIGVKHPDKPGAFMLGIECDGAMYHSSKAARDRDRLRHQVLEGLGWRLHHIWGTAWYRHPEREKERLRTLLEELSQKPMTGRLAASASPARPQVIVETVQHSLDESPDWIEDYSKASVGWVDEEVLRDVRNAPRLRRFVEEVAAVEAPLHIDVLCQRVRDHSTIERISARVKETILKAVEVADVSFDGAFLRTTNAGPVAVRRSTDDVNRKVEQVADEELRRAVELLIGHAIGISREDLVTQAARIFGWRRVGAGIRNRVEAAIDELLKEGAIEEGPGGFRRTARTGDHSSTQQAATRDAGRTQTSDNVLHGAATSPSSVKSTNSTNSSSASRSRASAVRSDASHRRDDAGDEDSFAQLSSSAGRSPRRAATSPSKASPSTGKRHPLKTTIPGDGTWLVGTDIEPGTYRTTHPTPEDKGSWYRLSNLTGAYDARIEEGYDAGPIVVTIHPTDIAFKTEDCGTWERIG
ncbi:Protein of unknown function [Raineyella antarctica]|uniref:AAA domain-containing protein n=1 Tax=Raineyella antarctica TaxID=1577474 RepID=A0A1G6IA99_9ACTN|nr:DUF3320 domain-containing protein [Raineyella antarctica]SDC03360.1 Protein of unknown function [Raineyella antarctica]